MSKMKNLGNLVTENKENAQELSAADIKVASDKDKIEKKISKLIIENKQNSKELSSVYKIIAKQEKEIKKQAADLIRTNNQKEKHKADLISAKKELAHHAELSILNKKLALTNEQQKLSKEKYIELYNFAPTGYFTLNREGKIIESNLFASQIFGKKHSFLKDHWFGDFVSEDTKTIFNNFLEQVFKSKTKQISDLTLLIDRNIRKYIYLNGIVTNNAEECFITIEDITERKQRIDALQKSEVKHSTMISNISDVIGIVGADGIIKYESPNIEKWFGWQPPDLIGTDGFSNVHPDDMERIKNEFFALLEKENLSITLECEYKCKDGIYKPIEITAKNLTNDPVINGVLLNYRDITDRKQVENALRESEHKSMSIMENSADAIFIANQQGKYVYTNKAVSALLGYTSEEMKSKTIADITNPNKQVEVFKIFNQVLNEGKGFNEIELLKKDGNYISTDHNAVILPDGTIYGSCRDITKRKLAESELIKAKEHAQESDRLKSAFLANMSHEIRTPMNGILGFAELLKEPELSGEQQQEYIAIIEKSGARMLNIINNIVDISKIESGLMEFNCKELNINEQMEYVYTFFKPEIEVKRLQFLLKKILSAKDAIISSDREKIYAILTNLVKNAVKYTNEGTIIFGCDKKGDNLEFFVKDTGIGIPINRQEAIFECFIQADITDKNALQGAGLGLTISKAYVELLGGRMWLESEEGKGTTFYFTIPYMSESEDKIVTKNTISMGTINQINPEISGLKILIAEDDGDSAILISKVVGKFCKEVLFAQTGEEVVEVCRNHHDIDLVLMDIKMPVFDGYEATRQIRQFNKNVVIIAQTAYALIGDSEKAISSGCNDYISKPIKRDQLLKLLQRYFKK
jgi:hypothetical protein